MHIQIACSIHWRAVIFLLCALPICQSEEECNGFACSDGAIFEEEESTLSLLQMKATQLPGQGVASATLKTNTEHVAAAQQKDQSPFHAPINTEHAATAQPKDSSSIHVASRVAEVLPVDVFNFSQLDEKSRKYLLHTICATLRERGQIAVIASFIIFTAVFANSIYRRKKGTEAMLQVQVRVDHFVTHSQVLPAKREAVAEALQSEAGTPQCKDIGDARPTHYSRSIPSVSSSSQVSVRDARESGLAPLDPSLVLPLCETWYAVRVEPMAMQEGSFEIQRVAGYPVLHGTLRRQDRLRVLEVTCSSVPAKQGQILASVSLDVPEDELAAPNVAGTSTAVNSLSVTGSDGKSFGHIRPEADGTYVLVCGEQDVMLLAPEDGRQLAVRSIESRKQLAQASWFEQSEFFAGTGHLAIRVNPNVDTVLMLVCTLSVTLLRGDKNLLRFTRPADRGAG